jgi:Tol biopolymer transport system component
VRFPVLLVTALVGCGDNLPGPDDAAVADVGEADPLGPWGAPHPMFLTSVADDDDPSLTADMLELYFNRDRDVYVSTRSTTSAPWSPPSLVAELSTPSFETTPEVSGDGLTLYLASDRAGGLGGIDIYVATRATRNDPWSVPAPVDALDSMTVDGAAYVTDDRTTAVIGTDRKANTDHDLFVSVRTDADQPWPTPVELAAVNSPAADWSPMLSKDKLTLYFVSYRSGGGDLYVSHRTEPTAAFPAPAPIAELSTPAAEADPWISPDGHHLVFTTDRDHLGIESLYEASR